MQDPNDSTRVMPSAAPGVDRTIVAGAPPAGAEATRMAPARTCPVCATSNAGLEQYCAECGFLLDSQPGTPEVTTEGPAARFELVDTAGRRFPLHEGDNIVGREAVDVVLMDPTVSRRHAVVRVQGDRVTVTDLGSTNGTLVDGAPAPRDEATEVASGASLRFGNATLVLAEGGPDSRPPAEPTITMADGGDTSSPAEGGLAATVVEGDKPLAAPAWLVAVDGSGSRHALNPTTTTIGRRPGNDVTLGGDPYLSGRHAVIECSDGVWTITDVGSTNGTTVNGVRLAADMPQTLEDGDEIGVGQGVYRFEVAPSGDAENPTVSAEEIGEALTSGACDEQRYGEPGEPAEMDEP